MDKVALQEQLQEWLDSRPKDSDPQWQTWANSALSAFWQRVEHLEFNGKHDKRIAYGVWPQPEPSPWLIISPGRIESYIKYQEIALEWAAKGYSIALIDHRGQGFSERLTDHHEHGHVERFKDYVDDFATWLELLQPRIGSQETYLLAHSMGGAIAALYLAHYGQAKGPIPFKAAALSSPMMGINTKPWPEQLGKAVVRFGAKVKKAIAPNAAHYFIGMKDYNPLPFASNDLTHSEQRYAWFTAMYREHPKIRLGGPTWQWLLEALDVIDVLPKLAPKVQVPLLVLQGGEDCVVMPEGQERFMANCTHPASQLLRVAGARHEILMESDEIRMPALAQIDAFFAQVHTESAN